MNEISVCLTYGHVVLHYGAGRASTVMFCKPFLARLKISKDPRKELITAGERITKYLLDEGFPLGYTLPFKILNLNGKSIYSLWQNEEDLEK